MSEEQPPSLYQVLRRWIHRRYGVFGLAVLAFSGGVFVVWTQWDKVRVLPGVSEIIERMSRASIPKADVDRFSVLLAQLENDVGREQHRLIREALAEFQGVEVLVLDRVIPLEGAVPEEEVERGHERARHYLRESGASVAIWGTVLRSADRAVPKLHWTSSDLSVRRAGRYGVSLVEDQLRLPAVFWSDLADVLRLLVVSHDTEFHAQSGRYIAERLLPFVASVRALLEGTAGRPDWDAESRNAIRIIFADVLLLLGYETREREPLEEAMSMYRAVLEERPIRRDRSAAQHGLGSALLSSGQQGHDIERVEQAIIAYREALRDRPREEVARQWAASQANLGAALATAGDFQADVRRLEEALVVLRVAQEEFTRERTPPYWAQVHSIVGSTLWRLGEIQRDAERLTEAVHVYRESLKEITQDRAPKLWAGAQDSLCIVLETLGTLEGNASRLREAIAACHEALKERTWKRAPRAWTSTQNNLANALSRLGELEGDVSHLEEAIAIFNTTLEALDAERFPRETKIIQTNKKLTESQLRQEKRR